MRCELAQSADRIGRFARYQWIRIGLAGDRHGVEGVFLRPEDLLGGGVDRCVSEVIECVTEPGERVVSLAKLAERAGFVNRARRHGGAARRGACAPAGTVR